MKTFTKRLHASLAMTLAILISTTLPSLAGASEVSRETWTPDLEVAQVGRFYIAGQPDEVSLEEARNAGVSMVINLRAPDESDWEEESVAESNGLQYHQVPVDGRAPVLQFAPFARITELVQADPDAKVLVHCASGNRAAAWLAVYLAQTQGQDTDQVIATARQAGLTSDALEAKVRNLLAE